jgi:hypothetical protein
MSNYFLLSAKDAPELASAFAPEGTKLSHDLISELENVNELFFELELVKLTSGKEGLLKSNDLSSLKEIWLDYQPNSLAWPLFSERLRTVFTKHLSGDEGVNWITAKINGNSEQRVYYIPRFEKKLDVLDTLKTIYVKGTNHVIKPCFSAEKINDYSVFHLPVANDFWKITSGLYVSEALKKALLKGKLTGIVFERITLS